MSPDRGDRIVCDNGEILRIILFETKDSDPQRGFHRWESMTMLDRDLSERFLGMRSPSRSGVGRKRSWEATGSRRRTEHLATDYRGLFDFFMVRRAAPCAPVHIRQWPKVRYQTAEVQRWE